MGYVFIYNLHNGSCTFHTQLKNHIDVNKLCFAKANVALYSLICGGYHGSMYLISDMGNKNPQRIINLEGVSSHIMSLTSTPELIVAGTYNGEVGFWNKTSGDLRSIIYSPSDVIGNKNSKKAMRPSVVKVVYHQPSNLILYATDNGYIFSVEVNKYQSLTNTDTAFRLSTYCELIEMKLDDNNEKLYISTNKPQIIIVDATDIKKWKPLSKDTTCEVIEQIDGFNKSPLYLTPTLYDNIVMTLGNAICYFLNLKDKKVECQIGGNYWSKTLSV